MTRTHRKGNVVKYAAVSAKDVADALEGFVIAVVDFVPEFVVV